MEFLSNLFPRQHYRLDYPFKLLSAIERRAFIILKKHPDSEISAGAQWVLTAISEFIDQDIEDKTDEHIDKLYNDGGWELSYLDGSDGEYPSRHEIDNLIRNWPSNYHDRPGVPTSEDYDQLPVLGEILNDTKLQHFIYPSGSRGVDFSPHEFYAVLALIQINSALGLLSEQPATDVDGLFQISYGKSCEHRQIVDAANLLLTAMEAVCLAERYLSDEVLEQYREDAKFERLERERIEREERDQLARSESGKNATKLRWERSEARRTLARKIIADGLKAWDSDRSLYENQGDFARDMESKIPTKDDGRPIFAASTIQVKLIQEIRSAQ